ncbi:ArsR/SmtB family transcription factor [Kribbella sp. NPDC059898]|uniref:ArsR/SmtB family transcription factor n=1 Tax=Kribbella sp. NPDC059898 TaxID=3346995 RepID=UPI003660A511
MSAPEPAVDAATVVRSGRSAGSTTYIRGAAGQHTVGPPRRQLASAARTFGLLSSPVRLHLVWLATQDSYDVGTLADRAGVSVATASQHLGKLRIAGLTTVHRQGRHHIYTVDDPHVRALVDQIFAHITPDGTLAPDRTPVPAA